MRDFKGMKRQRGRNRNGGGPSGGGKPQQNVNRAFDSNGPDNVKIRGHAQHVFEKYQQLARDAFSSGDRVLAENYLQHADHYFRVLRMLQPQRPAAEILGRDVFTSGLDIDFEDEGEGFEEAGDAAPEVQEPSGGYNGSDARDTRSDRDRTTDRDRQDRDRPDRDRQDRYESRPDRRDDRFEGRSDAPRTQTFEPRREAEGNRDTRRDTRRFDARPERAPRDGQGREGQGREGQARDFQSRDVPARDAPARDFQARDSQTRGEGASRGEYRDERPARTDDRRYGARNEGERAGGDATSRDADRRDPLAVIEPDNAPLTPEAFAEVEASPVLRSQDGGVSEAPAFLQSTVSLDDSGEARRPRTRRRRPKALDEGDDAAPAPAVEEA
jgi:hypothetical protein